MVLERGWGSLGREIGQFRLPHTMVVDRAGQVYVGDGSNSRIQVFDSDGNFLRVLDGTILGWLGSSGRQLGQFNWIHSLDCSQLDDGVLWVADMNNWRIQKLIVDLD